jgi:D-tyrosyl-tRNA(Tyr) deacylase
VIAVVQRVSAGSVKANGNTVGEIGRGLVVLAAVHADDTEKDGQWMAEKLAGLRIFPQGEKNFDLDVKQIGGGILLVSNFTVAADTRSGRRPSLSGAAGPERGRELFEKFVEAVRAQGVTVATGEFGADMSVEIANDGPSTFLVDSRTAR